MNNIRILIVEDHMMVRESFRLVLKLEKDFEIIGEARTGREAISLALDLSPDVILMDIAMPSLNGLEATRQLMKALPETRIIILTAHSDDAYVRSAVDSGAAGFMVKHDSTRDICKAIREVHKGKICYSQSVAKRFVRINPQSINRHGKTSRKSSLLTTREAEVLQLIAEGKANKETAAELSISIKTVEKHRGQLMRKLDIHDTAGLTRYAIATGVIESSVQITFL